MTRLTDLSVAAAALFASSLGTPAHGAPPLSTPGEGKFCSTTANMVFGACGLQSQADAMLLRAKCLNIGDAGKRTECQDEATKTAKEAAALCAKQLGGRRSACGTLGEGRYDPSFDPALFDTDFRNLTKPNPYFPLTIGNRWEYASGKERDIVEVTADTKLIDGLTCIVRSDMVYDGNKLVEATYDWVAAKRDGSTWYCGEEVKNYETFKGDRPRRPELVNVNGSFKHGRAHDKAGMLMPAQPVAGQLYMEEYALGNAEDVAEVLAVNYSYGKDVVLDRFVPADLAQRMCNDDCVVTKNYALMEPGIVELKYYARGIGFFLETKPDDGEVLQLVNCNFDARCSGLPGR